MDILYFLFLGLVVGFWGGGDLARRRIRRHIEDARTASDSEASAPRTASDSEASPPRTASLREARRRLSPEEVDALSHAAASAAKQGQPC